MILASYGLSDTAGTLAAAAMFSISCWLEAPVATRIPLGSNEDLE
jgi:hypothetical protein